MKINETDSDSIYPKWMGTGKAAANDSFKAWIRDESLFEK